MTNTKLLELKISESGLKKKYLAEKLDLSPYGLSQKINSLYEFKASEIQILCEELNISLEERQIIFFALG